MPGPEMRCARCGGAFRPGSAHEARRRRFCSRACYAASRVGETPRRWTGGRSTVEGYVRVLEHGHHRATERGYVLEHVLIAERALGKALPAGAEVHHVNEDRADNRRGNLVVCQDRAYHLLLHWRAAAIARGERIGITKRCRACGELKPVAEYARDHRRTDGRYTSCRRCWNAYAAGRREARKGMVANG